MSRRISRWFTRASLALVISAFSLALLAPSAFAGWSPFYGLGGATPGGPAVVSSGSGTLWAAVRGTDNYMYHNTYRLGKWSGWYRLSGDNGQFSSDPAMSVDKTGRFFIRVGRGTDGVAYYSAMDATAGGWTPWRSLCTSVAGGLSVAISQKPRPDHPEWAAVGIVARDPGDNSYKITDTPFSYLHSGNFGGGTTCPTWKNIGGALTSDPAVVWTDTHVPSLPYLSNWEIFGRGTNGIIHYKRISSNYIVEVPWTNLGFSTAGGVGASSWNRTQGSRRIDLFARGTDNQLIQKTFDETLGGWLPVNQHGGILTADPDAVSWDSNRVDVLVTGLNGIPYWKYWNRY